jgi:nucleotidyltransferase/DNA polymerase involved in DNA repair
MLHMDGDAFFVACEIAKDPSLKGKPVVTGQERGIVSAFSYEAKALGVTRAMPIYRVKKDFPEVVVLSGDYKTYREYSKKMFDIVRRYADDLEEYSIDECFADLTGLDKPLKMSYLEIAERIQKEVEEELGLSVTIGLAPNKVIAKVASKWVKPHGLTVITKERIGDFLKTFPVGKIWGIGPKSAESMNKKGIFTAGEFREKEERWVIANFSKLYHDIWLELSGQQIMKLNAKEKVEYASIQRTETFHPSTNSKDFLLTELSSHIEDACNKAREYDLTPKKISFFLKNQKLEYAHCSFALSAPTNTPETIIKLVHEKIDEVYRLGVMYRATGVTLQNLIHNNAVQMDLFGETSKADTLESLYKQIDALEGKFGKRVVHLASTKKQSSREKESAKKNESHLLFM